MGFKSTFLAISFKTLHLVFFLSFLYHTNGSFNKSEGTGAICFHVDLSAYYSHITEANTSSCALMALSIPKRGSGLLAKKKKHKVLLSLPSSLAKCRRVSSSARPATIRCFSIADKYPLFDILKSCDRARNTKNIGKQHRSS